MIERDLLHLHVLVESHQADLKREWAAAQAGPGPIRQAIGRQLIHLGEVLGGKHADRQALQPTAASPVHSALSSR